MQKGLRVSFTLQPKTLLIGLFLSPLMVLLIYSILLLPWSSPNAPAWVQAIGSISAILVAIAVPAFQRRQDQKDQQIERFREDYQVARIKLRLLLETKALLDELGRERPPHGFDFTWHNPARYQTRIKGVMIRLENAIAVERNDSWWQEFMEIQEVLSVLNTSIRELDLDDPQIINQAKYHAHHLNELTQEIEDFLLQLEGKYPEIYQASALSIGDH
ncbi:hypothetical protein ACYCGP_08785 [Stutzerimonas nitrititolerans]